MSDLYVIDGEAYVIPHGAMVTRVTVEGSRRNKGRQLEILRSLAWLHGSVIRTQGERDYLVYLPVDATVETNQDVNRLLLALRDRGAFLAEGVADRIIEPNAPYPHTDERLMHAVQAGQITADGFAVRLHFDSATHGQTLLYHAVRSTVEEALRTVSHIERPCTACLRPYQNVVYWDSEFAMADVVPFVVIPF